LIIRRLKIFGNERHSMHGGHQGASSDTIMRKRPQGYHKTLHAQQTLQHRVEKARVSKVSNAHYPRQPHPLVSSLLLFICLMASHRCAAIPRWPPLTTTAPVIFAAGSPTRGKQGGGRPKTKSSAPLVSQQMLEGLTDFPADALLHHRRSAAIVSGIVVAIALSVTPLAVSIHTKHTVTGNAQKTPHMLSTLAI
jgi:hypothetical protein